MLLSRCCITPDPWAWLINHRQRFKSEGESDPMTPALLGKKIGMTRVYDAKGAIVPVTVVQAGPCAVTQVKTQLNRTATSRVQLGFDECKTISGGKEKVRYDKFTMPLMGHCAKAGVTPRRHFKEIRLKEADHRRARRHRRRRYLQRSAICRRDRHQQGQRLRRRHEAPSLRRPVRFARHRT